jgi:hypothetical protein
MAKWKRWGRLLVIAVVCGSVGMLAPLGLFALGAAVLAFLFVSRWFGVASFSATLVFALVVTVAPIVTVWLITPAFWEINWYETFWTAVGVFGLSGPILFFLLPILVSLASYLARGWVYTPNSAVNPDAPSARRLP